MSRRRVVVTGLGALAPNGNDLDSFWDALVNGRSGIGPITKFDASEHRAQIAGEIKGFDAEAEVVVAGTWDYRVVSDLQPMTGTMTRRTMTTRTMTTRARRRRRE